MSWGWDLKVLVEESDSEDENMDEWLYDLLRDRVMSRETVDWMGGMMDGRMCCAVLCCGIVKFHH